jgi:hypothetical protein
VDAHEQLLRFGGGGGTALAPLAAVLLLLAIAGIFALRPRHIAAPLLVASFCVPLAQQLVIAGLHFTMFRIIILVSWVRVMCGGVSRSGRERFRLSLLDKVFLMWAAAGSIAFVILWDDTGAFIDRLGFLYNALGTYFLFRVVWRGPEDVDRAVKVLAVVCAVIALCMMNEHWTNRNLFSMFGGVPEFSYIREGKLRAQAAFAHPITAGTFGATLMPLFARLWRNGKVVAAIGIIASIVITIASMSSTPVLALCGGIVALCMWPLRRQMRLIRWGILITLVILHFYMNGPVWSLIAHIDLIGGSSGYHRYALLNQFIVRFDEWALVGTTHADHWCYECGDTSNQYIDIGVMGGVVTLALFLALIVQCFKGLGRTRKMVDKWSAWGFWSLGAALFANIVGFFGISYFDQTLVAWYALLAMIATVTSAAASAGTGVAGLSGTRARDRQAAFELAASEWSVHA